MTAEANEMPAVGGHAVMVRRYVEDRLAALPAEGDAYHRGLLDVHTDLLRRGHDKPGSAIAGAMRVPEETVRACLQAAWQRLEFHG